MRSLYSLAIIGALFAVLMPIHAKASSGSYDMQAVVVVEGLDDAGLARLAKEVSKEAAVTLEYACVWSGVVVLKYASASSGERADAITLVRRTLAAAGYEKGVEVLHVHLEGTGPGKC